jgi:hypothetical protein
MSTIVNNLTISGYKAFGLDAENTDLINNTITSANIYKYQASAIASSLSQTIYLDGSTAGTRGGAKTVDTLSVMVSTADVGSTVIINGYTATRGVGNTNTTLSTYSIDWAVWPSQAAGSSNGVGNLPAYTVTPGTSNTANTLSTVKLSGTYNSNNALNVSEGINNLIIEVITPAGARTVLTYYVVIVSSSTRLSSLIPTLSPNALVPGYSYSPAFNSNYNDYTNQIYKLNVNPSSTTMTLTPTTTVGGIESVIRITSPNGSLLAPITSGTASSSFPIADNNSVTVEVTSPDGVTKQEYVLSIQSDVSGNNLSVANFFYYDTATTLTPFNGQVLPYPASNSSWLSGINPNGENTASPPVKNLVNYTSFSYLNTIPNVSYGLSVYLKAVDSGATVSVGNVTMPFEGTFLIPYSSLTQGAQNVIVCKCTSSSGVVKTYNINIWLAGSDTSPNTAGILSNISFNSSQAVYNADTLFNPSLITSSSSLNFTPASFTTAGVLPYIIYVNPSTASTALTVNLTYNDNGSRFSTNLCQAGTAAGWVNPSSTTPGGDTTLNANTTLDNWTIGSVRSTTVTVPVGVIKPSDQNYLLVASHLPGSSLYYGYYIQFVTPQASVSSISLASSITSAPISLNPSFTSINESYSAYIGTAAAPTSFVNLTSIFTTSPATFVVDYLVNTGTGGSTPQSTAYNSNQKLTSNTSVTVSLKANATDAVASSYILYVRMFDTAVSSSVPLGYYTLNLLNIDQSLLLSGLNVFNQNVPSTTTGIFPPPESTSVIVPSFGATTFVYNAPISFLYGAIQPTITNPSVKTITISLNGATPVPVISGSYFRFPITSRNIAAQITITDNLSPSNSNTYTVFIYSNSSNLNLLLANFQGILNSDFSPQLPNGTTITNVLTAPAGGSLTVTSSNAAVSTTRFTGTPQQSGTSMYLASSVGFEPLTPGVASSVITLTPNVAKTIPVWFYATNNTSIGTFNFGITQVPDTNSFLSNMVLTNCTNFVFNPTTQNYSGIVLTAPNTSFTFTATSASSNSSISYSFNGGTPVTIVSGAQIPIATTNYLPTANNLIISVTPQSGPIRTYTFNIVRNANFYLTNLKVYISATVATASKTDTTEGTVLINPSPFNPLFYTYSSEVAPTIDTAYVVLSKAPESTITMTGASIFGLNASGEQIWAVPVQVSTSPQNTLVYSINPSTITVSVGAQSSVYNLAIVRKFPVATAASISLSKGGITIPLRNQLGVLTTFDPLVFTYTIPPVNTGPVDVSIVGQGNNDYNLNGAAYYVPTNVVIDTTHPIVIGVVNNDGSRSIYQISLL